MKNNDLPNIITLGSIGRPYALKGWMHLNSFTDPPEKILSYPNLLIQRNSEWLPFKLSAHDVRFSNILIKIDDCNTPEEARHYTNCAIGTMRDQLPKLPKGEYYWSDLEGLTVINKEGVVLGCIDHLFETGSNDIIVVQGDKERLLPYIKDTVLNINLERKEMMVDWDPDF